MRQVPPFTLTSYSQMPLSAALLRKLVCPKCKGELDYRPDSQALICGACRLQFAVKDDIPIMLLAEATPL